MRRQEVILRDEAQRRPFLRFIETVSLEKPIKITVELYHKKRSLSANSLMWAWLNEAAKALANETGATPDEMHTALKQKLLTPKIIEVAGQTIAIYSTKNLTTAEFANYMDQVYAFIVGEMGIYLPTPQEHMAR